MPKNRNPRAEAIGALYEHAAELAMAGDVAAARALHDAIGKLFADAGAEARGAVIDLGERRRER